MKARLITRCGCERVIEVPYPPPPKWCVALRPRVPNGGLVRPWLNETGLTYDPKRDGLERREFVLSLESLDTFNRWGNEDSMVWYDERTEYDPAGFNADARSYEAAPPKGTEK